MKRLIIFAVLAIALASCGNNSRNKNNEPVAPKGVTWQMGNIVNDWDEPTGEHYIFAHSQNIIYQQLTRHPLLWLFHGLY